MVIVVIFIGLSRADCAFGSENQDEWIDRVEFLGYE